MSTGSGGVIAIEDPRDPRVEPYRNQKDVWLRAQRGESPGGLFVAEGVLVLGALVRSGYRVHSVLVSETRLGAVTEALEGLAGDVPVYVAGQGVMDEVVGFHIHRGVLACGYRPSPEVEGDVGRLAATARTLVVLEDLSNHDNVGGVFRVAAALGGPSVGVVLSPGCADPLYRKALRVSMGHGLLVPYARAGSWPGDLSAVMDAGHELVALTPGAGSESIEGVVPGGRVALVVGAEGPGLSEAVLGVADRRVRIPIWSGVDSLNVVTAAAIALHRLVRPGEQG